MIVKPGFAQNLASASCSGVRVSEKWRTSASAARYSGEPNAGGGPGRNWLPVLRKNGRIRPSSGKTGATPGALTQQPGQTGMTTPATDGVKPSVAALARTDAP